MGVLGGMGMFATTHFITEFLTQWAIVHEVKKEWEFPKYLVYANPQLPSRSRHIFYGEESPLEVLLRDIARLNRCGIDFIAIPCNTVHFYYKELQKASAVRILNMIEIVSDHVLALGDRQVRVIGTEAVFRTKLYDDYGLKHTEYCEDIDTARQIIDAVKHCRADERTVDLLKEVLDKDKLNLLCCTELSALYAENKEAFEEYEVMDPLSIFIDHIVNVAYQSAD